MKKKMSNHMIKHIIWLHNRVLFFKKYANNFSSLKKDKSKKVIYIESTK